MFAAVYPPAEVVADLRGQLEAVKAARGVSDDVRWNDPELWHLTLAFMPAVADDRLGSLRRQLDECAQRHPHPPVLQIKGAGAFHRSSLWWALRDSDPSAARWLDQLARDVRRTCRAAGAVPDDSAPWRPHLTIGRVRRDAPNGTAREWLAALADVESTQWVAGGFALVASVTGPIVSHTVVEAWEFAG